MREYGLHETLQSAYKTDHSAETPLLKINDRILRAMDEECGLLVLPDQPASWTGWKVCKTVSPHHVQCLRQGS